MGQRCTSCHGLCAVPFCGLPILQALTAIGRGLSVPGLMCRAPARPNLDSEMAEAPPQCMSLKLSDLVPEAPEAAQRILKGNCHPWQVCDLAALCCCVHNRSNACGQPEPHLRGKLRVLAGLSSSASTGGVLLSCWWHHTYNKMQLGRG